MEGDKIVMTEIFTFAQSGMSTDGKVIGELKATGIRPMFTNRYQQTWSRNGRCGVVVASIRPRLLLSVTILSFEGMNPGKGV